MGRIKPEQEIIYICSVIDKNIEAHKILKDRGLLSENILSQLRNLTEDVAIFINNTENSLSLDIHYNNVNDSIKYVSSVKKYKYISVFHKFLQSTASHYTPSEDDAERLVLYYFRYICMIKQTLENLGIIVLKKLEDFPIYEDNLTKEHYKNIGNVIDTVGNVKSKALKSGRFYVVKNKPIYANGKLYYEITLTKATDYTNKFERILMYTKYYIPDNYSIKISYQEKSIELFSLRIKIKVIDNYFISIRPCELKNIGLIFGINNKIDDNYAEYSNLMRILTDEEKTLLELVLMDNELFEKYIEKIKGNAENNNITNLLVMIREHLLSSKKGRNILRYFLVKPDNKVIKTQLCDYPNNYISYLYLVNQSIPFDSMPYAMSLSNHNISWINLINAIDIEGRNFELLGRYIKNNCESNNILYTSCDEVDKFGNIDELIEEYNDSLVRYGIDRQQKGKLVKEYDNVYIKSYEDTSIEIINTLNSYNSNIQKEFAEVVDNKKEEYLNMDLSEDKKEILNDIFRKHSIGIIHGPAGTGKTKMLEVLSMIFCGYSKIFLSNTNTAVENLRARISGIDLFNSTFKTVANYNKYDDNDYDILIIDECSMISNKDMLKAIKKQRYKLVILAGDVFQIESIKYGNWFSLSYYLFKNEFVYDLIQTNRTDDIELLELWKMIRDNDDNALNKINSQEYSSPIDFKEIFNKKDTDEIILCLNYDGLYGINNINKVLQEKNSNIEYTIGVDTFKIEDPIVFNDCPRFRDLYNNLKGTIKNIEKDNENDCVWFTILVDDILYNSENNYEILRNTDNKTLIRLYVRNFKDTNDDDDDRNEHIIPFNLAYAVSIHKAQGLEYNSVKIIITSNVEEQITKNIFYTAITRTKTYLKIFWSPESQMKIFDNMKKRNSTKDVAILKNKINIT
ncbi:MAG: helicase [Clostridiales bacterium]|nr:helicase [Clostridiales bacterium]